MLKRLSMPLIETELFGRYGRNSIKREYEQKPAVEGLTVIDGMGASAITASRQPETPDPIHQIAPYLVENRRNTSISTLPLSDMQQTTFTSQPKKKDEKPGEQYHKYGSSYKQYREKVYGTRARLQQIYRSSLEKLSKAVRSFYEGKTRTSAARNLYNPFKKSRLEAVAEKVESLPPYQTASRVYPITRRLTYRRMPPQSYIAKQNEGDLEERLKAA